MQTLGPLEIGEIKAARFSFAKEKAASSSLTGTPVVTCVVVEGTDASASSILQGTATIDGDDVVQFIRPGVSGCKYKLLARVSDDSGLRHNVPCYVNVVAA